MLRKVFDTDDFNDSIRLSSIFSKMELKIFHLYILFKYARTASTLWFRGWIKDVTIGDKNIAFILPFLSSLQLRWLKKKKRKRTIILKEFNLFR